MSEQTEPDLDSIIERLLEGIPFFLFNSNKVRGSRPGKQVQLAEYEIRFLCTKAREIFINQPILLELEAPLKICGDIHGQYYDLLRLFEYGGFPPEANYLFLGDYVDRGKQSLETICLLLAYKIKYPENFFILRGNHECASINRIYGFYDECSSSTDEADIGKRRYNIKLWKTFTDCFNCLPIAAIIDEKIFTMHGGLSPDLSSMEQIRRVMRPTDVPDTGPFPLPLFRQTCSCRPPMRPPLVRSRQGHNRLVRKRQRRLLHIRSRRRLSIPPKTRYGPYLSSTSSRRGRVRVLFKKAACHVVQCA